MITQMEVLNPRVITAPFNVLDDDELVSAVSGGLAALDPVQIKNIDGLGPVPASVNTIQYGSVDGEFYNDSTVGKRNIVLTVGINPNWAEQSIEEIRQIMYTYFLPKSKITLRFNSTHMAEVAIDGVVETFEPNLFAKTPEYQISIICPKPDFIATTSTIETGVTLPINDEGFSLIDYQGTSETGFVLTVSSADLSSGAEFRAYNQAPDLNVFIGTPGITPSYSFVWSTVSGDKYARLIPTAGGLVVNALNKITAGSQWFPLRQGLNTFQVQTTTPGLDWSLEYFAHYGGL
jgi:hypothetical protein